jgi:hypothetical protein
VNRPVAAYRPSRRYILFAALAIFGTLFSAWTGLRWPSTWIAAALFALTSAGLIALLCRPRIEIHETHLQVGRRVIFWPEIRRLDQTGWIAPLAVNLTLSSDRRVLLIYAGDLDSSTSLLRHLRRYSRHALLDGVPYRQAWGETEKAPDSGMAADNPPPATPHRPFLRPEDEQEIEKMFQRLKTAGRLDRGSDEK